MMDAVLVNYALSASLYLLGALFMLSYFEPTEDTPPTRYIVFVFAWPLITLWDVLRDLFGSNEE